MAGVETPGRAGCCGQAPARWRNQPGRSLTVRPLVAFLVVFDLKIGFVDQVGIRQNQEDLINFVDQHLFHLGLVALADQAPRGSAGPL